MPIVAMPDGAQVQFPDDMPHEQIRGLIAQKFPQLATQSLTLGENQPSPPDLIDRLTADFTNRKNQINQAGDAYRAGDKSAGRMAADIAGAYGGGISDIFMNGLGSAGRMVSVGQPDANNLTGTSLTDIAQNAGGRITNLAMQPGTAYAPSPSDMVRYVKQQIGPDATAVASDAINAISAIPAARGLAMAGDMAAPLVRTAIKAPAEYIGGGIGKRIGGLRADSLDQLDTNIKDNYSAASQTLTDAHNQGAALTPEASQSIVDNINSTLKENRFNPAKHPGTNADITAFKTKAANGSLTLEDIDNFRQDLGDTIGDNNKFKGKAPDGYQAVQIKNALLDNISGLGDNSFTQGGAQSVADLRTGINQYAQAARYEKVANIARSADGDSAAFARGLKNFTKKDSNSKGFSDEEWQSLKDASSKGIGGTIENWLGKFGIDANRAIAPAAISMAKAGGAYVIPGGAPLVGLGTIARATSKLATKGGYQDALDLIMNRGTEVSPPNPQISGMRARINAANNAPSTIPPDPLALPAPNTEYIIDGNGNVVPSYRTNAQMQTSTNLANQGLTPDVLAAQKAQQVGSAYEQNAGMQAAFDQARAKALEQAFTEHQITGAQPNSAMMGALQKAFMQRKLNAK